MTLKTLTLIAAAIPVAIAGYFFILGMVSKSGEPPGIVDGRLAPCSSKPNCVCSEFLLNERHYIAPLNIIKGKDDAAWAKLKASINQLGGSITDENERYIAAKFSSMIFGFVDDFEVRLDRMNHQIQFRSASRVGTSDFGVNRKRVEAITGQLQAFLKG